MIKSVESRELRNWIVDGSELALIDLREEGEFSAEDICFLRSVYRLVSSKLE